MAIAPEPVLKATLKTLHWALICCRNWTIPNPALPVVPSSVIYDLMEAIHEVPDFLIHWERHDLDQLKMYLGCFKWQHWRQSVDAELHYVPDLVADFERKLAEYEKG